MLPGGLRVIASGVKVFDAEPARGRFIAIETPDDVLDLMDNGAAGVVALVRDAGATFLAPIYHELTGVICTGGTPRSHIGIVSREFQIPCVMGAQFDGELPEQGATVEIDCSGDTGIIRG
jgi:phosphohistidine swiveling domain-containing protein